MTKASERAEGAERRKRFTAQMLRLAEAFGEHVSRARLEAYWDALQGFGAERVDAAIRDAIKTCKRFPPPAVLIELMPPVPRAAEHRALPPVVDWEGNQQRIRELLATLDAKMTRRA
jgi:hypothetical protein